MGSNNYNDARKKQKKTGAVHGEVYSLNDSMLFALSFGTILKEFQDFLFCLLPYIGDRVIWNAIASSNKDVHEKSKALLPPWPFWYKLPSSHIWSVVTWSPCGTRIACTTIRSSNIAIVDQRFGPLRNNGHINAHDGCRIDNLKYSPNGRFLVSTGYDGFVKIWDNITGTYEQLQEWNLREVVARGLTAAVPKFCISACSTYIVVAVETCVFLKDVERGGKTIAFIQLNEDWTLINRIKNIMFSPDDRAVFICCNGTIKVWRPFLDDDDEDRLITLTNKSHPSGTHYSAYNTYKFSNDNTMVVIHNTSTKKGILWSINMDHNYVTQKAKFPAEGVIPFFTPDNKYIVCNKENRPKFWSLAEGKFTNTPIHFLDNGSNSNYTKHNNLVVQCLLSFSPNNRQCIVQATGSNNRYIISYFVT